MRAIVGFGSPQAVGLWLVALAIATGYLLRQVYRREPVTPTTFVVFFWFVLPILWQYPFTFSPLNIVFATGATAYDLYVREIDRALYASLLGMAAFWLAHAMTPARARPFLPVRAVAYGLRGWTSESLIWLSGIAVALLFVPFAVAGLTGAEGLRNIVMNVPALRPLFNTVATILPVLLALGLMYALHERRASLWALLVLLLVLSVVTGSRAVAFGGLLFLLLSVSGLASAERRIRPRSVLLAIPPALLGLLVVIYLGNVRDGQYNPLLTIANFGALVFYGNNFSDLRDFAWVMAYWNGEHFLGRTQLAGFTGFIPSALWDFRVEWGWGRVSTAITGLGFREADSLHPGLRPGMFGESFFNFGWAGVAAAGLLMGWVAARTDAAVRHVLALPSHTTFDARLGVLAAFVALNLWANVFITAGFYAVWVTAAVLLLVRVVRLALRLGLAEGLGSASAPSPARADAP